jgi:hypothetical protein
VSAFIMLHNPGLPYTAALTVYYAAVTFTGWHSSAPEWEVACIPGLCHGVTHPRTIQLPADV